MYPPRTSLPSIARKVCIPGIQSMCGVSGSCCRLAAIRRLKARTASTHSGVYGATRIGLLMRGTFHYHIPYTHNLTQTHTPPHAPVMLVTRELGLGGSERQLAETALASAGVPVLELGVRSLMSRSALEGAHRLGAYVARHGIRLVHAFDVPSDLFAVPAARFYRVPVVLSSMRAHRDLTPGMTRHLLRITDRIVDAIVVNSQAVARQLIGEDHVPPSMIRLAYNGLDTSTFCREGTRAALPWSDGAPVVGVVCALRPEKGLAVLLDA